MNLTQRSKGFLLGFLCISWLSSGVIVVSGQAIPRPVFRVDSAETELGQQVTLDLVIQAAPLGINRLEVLLFLDDPMLATLDQVKSKAIRSEFFQILEQTSSRVHFRAVDFEDQIVSNTSDLVVASLTFQPHATGTSTIVAFVSNLVDDANNAINPIVINGVLDVVSADRVRLASGQGLPTSLPHSLPPKDLDQDGLFEDLNGDGRFTQDDLLLLMKVMEEAAPQAINAPWFDFNQDGVLSPDDVAALLNQSTVFQVGVQQTTVNQTALVSLVLLQAPHGLRQYDITIELTTPGNIRLVGLMGMFESMPDLEVVEATTTAIRLQAIDFFDLIKPGKEPIVFAELALESYSTGASPIRISVNSFLDDENHNSIPIAMDGWIAFINGPNRLTADSDLPQDLNGDGLFEDVNGDGAFNLKDPTLLGFSLYNFEVQDNVQYFDFNGDNRVDFDDVTTLAGLVLDIPM